MYNLLELLVWQGKSKTWRRLVSARRKREPRRQVHVIIVGAPRGMFNGVRE